MDEDISRWILEYLLRQQLDEKFINGLLSTLPLSNDDVRLKKTLLLRKIDFEISNTLISEKLLDYFELIEELDHRQSKTAFHSMKLAYCAVAVDSTVRFLEETVEKSPNYVDAIQRIWKERVCVVEGLISDESKRWFGDIVAAICDSEVCGRILMINTRNEALKAVRVYLKEAWGSVGPTFLELVAEKFVNSVECGGEGGGVGNPCRELVPFQGTSKSPSLFRRKHVATKKRQRGGQRGAKLSITDEGNEDECINKSKSLSGDEGNRNELINKTNTVPTPKLDKVQPALEPSSTEQNPQKLTSPIETDNLDNAVVENSTNYDLKTTPEVKRIKKALIKSSKELRASVKDPLPDALQTANILTSMKATNRVSGKNGTGSSEKIDDPNPDTRDNEGQCRSKRKRNPTKPSLMEPNGTSHTFEWDDSIENSSEHLPTRPRLTSPKEINSSPLKSYNGLTKITKRRVRKAWTPLEEDRLRKGVQKFGKGNWKLILHCYHEELKGRTEVDLKDKWRNLTKSS